MNTMVIVMVIAVIAIGLVLLIVMSLTRRGGQMLDQEKYRSEWLRISQSITDNPDSWQFAVLSADKLLDKAMRERGIPGDTMGERLKVSKNRFSNINRVWEMHKLRNRIAHEHNVNVSKRQAGEALKVFKKALQELGAL